MRPTRPIPLVDPLLGSMVGEYRVEGVIGEGGMGVVYRGVHPVIGKPVAIKVLKASLAKNEGLTKRLVEEARAVNAIEHRNIIDIFGLGELPDGRPYIVMEHLAGEPLDALLRREGKLREEAAVRLLLELCQPLEAAHRAGVVHRDLKPGNVFLCDSPDEPRYLKLLDFGLARRTAGYGTSTSQTNRAFIVGTPNYLSPEQAQGGDISDRTDVYALGVMLFEFLTGTVPFTGKSAIDVAMAHVSRQPARVAELEPTVSPALTSLVARMLAKHPLDRPTVEELRRALAPSAAPRPAPSAPRPQDSGRQRRDLTVTMNTARRAQPRLASVAIVGGLVALIAGLAWALTLTPSTAANGTVVPEGRPVTPVTPMPPVPPEKEPAPVAALPAPAPPLDPTPRPTRQPARVPTIEELLVRVTALEKRLRASTPAGEAPDPAALRLLGSYRLKVELASTPAARAEVVRKLDAWQRAHP